MKTHHELTEIMNFISEYASVQLGSGVHTSRVARNTHRLGEALDIDVRISTFQKNAIISINDVEDEMHITRVVPIPALPISFRLNSDLSTLSWEAVDSNLSFSEIKSKFQQLISKKPLNPIIVTFTVGFANASFCHLFGGDAIAMLLVFIATITGFTLKQWLTYKEVANYIIVTSAAFISSVIAGLAINFDCNANIAIATSPLYLVPGVHFINGFIDIVEGYTLIGISRLVNALLLIICIAAGMSAALSIIDIPFL